MWTKISSSLLEENKFYKTALYWDEEYTSIQMLKHYRGLWFTQDGMYVYYTPTHYFKD